jgi:hypothetical protein
MNIQNNEMEIIFLYYKNINEYEGDIKKGKFIGIGILYDENGR